MYVSCNRIKCLVMELMYVSVSQTDNHASVMSCAFPCHGLIMLVFCLVVGALRDSSQSEAVGASRACCFTEWSSGKKSTLSFGFCRLLDLVYG